MKPDVLANIQQYLDALHEIEKNEHCSASLLLHPSGSGAVEVDYLFTRMGHIAIDFDTEDGDDIMDAIHRLVEKVRQTD